MPEETASLAALEAQIQELRSAVSSLGRVAPPTSRVSPPRSRTETVREVAAPTGPPFTIFVPDDYHLIGDGNGAQAETTAELAEHVGEGAIYAYVRFSASAGEDDDSIEMKHRPTSDGDWATALHLIAIQEAADSAANDNSEWVVLAEDGTFQYLIEGDGAAAWSLTLLGYA